ncbi:uncharacterized protein BX663DRAFT_500289 [Cokeromyces recurvatus]|uniref:uncharacterized protein n=1 Tax=Cokeromyces recurvatus TaxID=90255 RepID=UPI00221E839C|nr:uncharacterized protein BX663DRAFT_500289 [Cokeromyces recurvatus]KAI7905601.1 hypothetical protein BX663DRAFT_500289 [Cokeromyces recurvatus]
MTLHSLYRHFTIHYFNYIFLHDYIYKVEHFSFMILSIFHVICMCVLGIRTILDLEEEQNYGQL